MNSMNRMSCASSKSRTRSWNSTTSCRRTSGTRAPRRTTASRCRPCRRCSVRRWASRRTVRPKSGTGTTAAPNASRRTPRCGPLCGSRRSSSAPWSSHPTSGVPPARPAAGCCRRASGPGRRTSRESGRQCGSSPGRAGCGPGTRRCRGPERTGAPRHGRGRRCGRASRTSAGWPVFARALAGRGDWADRGVPEGRRGPAGRSAAEDPSGPGDRAARHPGRVGPPAPSGQSLCCRGRSRGPCGPPDARKVGPFRCRRRDAGPSARSSYLRPLAVRTSREPRSGSRGSGSCAPAPHDLYAARSWSRDRLAPARRRRPAAG